MKRVYPIRHKIIHVFLSADVPLHNPKKDWKIYKSLVLRLTEKQPLHTLENYDKRGFKEYHVDHKVSIKHGFKNNINPHLIADISNLRMLSCIENTDKGIKCFFDDLNKHLR